MSVPEELSSASDLKDAIKARLMHSGTWSEIQSRLRAEVFHSLNDCTVKTPDRSDEIETAFQIISDFLNAMKLENSHAVFLEEIGQERQAQSEGSSADRYHVARGLGVEIDDNQGDVPLLLLLMQHVKAQQGKNINR